MRVNKKRLKAGMARFHPEVVDYRTLEAKRLGECIVARRTYLKVNQKQLAALADLTPAAMCRIEQGQAMPKVGSITRICAALQCSLTQLIYPVNPSQGVDTASGKRPASR